MAPSRVAGGLAHSSSSGIFCQGDGFLGDPQLGPTYENASKSVFEAQNPNIGNISSGVVSPVPSVGANSMVTDANSPFQGGPNFQRSASFSADIYRMPASQLSFSANNASVSGSSIMDGQNLNNTLNNVMHLQKKPRLDAKEEEIIMRQILQKRNSLLQSRNQNPQLQALIQQQQQQQQQFLQSIPSAQRAHILQQQQMRQQIQHQTMQPISSMKRPHDNGICSRRLMKYLYHLRQHPPENTISYWRKFVAEYYSPRAKKRWCLSLYNNVGNHSLGVFPQANMDAWHCDICGSKSGKGFEATFEVLARLNEIKFASGVIDELLFLDLPRETTFPSGIMMLEYGKAVEESVYEQLRVVREGRLRIIFSPDLKILSWEFCACRHEELLPRRLIAPQVNQLLQVAQKCQSTITECRAEGISQQDLQTNSNMVVTAGRQLAKTLELQSLNDLGFSKRYVRCLQIAEVVRSMKNLMNFCGDQKLGPIEGLKTYNQHGNSYKPKMEERHDEVQLANIKGLSMDQDTPNKFINGQMDNTENMVSRGGLSGSAQAALALTSYQNMVMKQNLTNSNNSNQNTSLIFQKPAGNTTVNMQSSPFIGGFISSLHPQVSNGNRGGTQKPSLLGQNDNGSSGGESRNLSLSGQNSYENAAKDGTLGPAPSRINSFKVALNNNPVNGDDHKDPVLPQSDPLSDDMVKEIADEFIENGFFSSDFNDIEFDWRM